MTETPIDLTGKLLIAMPGMGDPRFETAVVYICAHSAEAAMGLIVNKPVDALKMDDLLEQLDIPPGRGSRDVPVHFGGPVEPGRGFVLHSDDYAVEGATLEVSNGFSMTATRDVLGDIARGEGPARRLLALGYAGWGGGQLEEEIAQNGWLTCAASAEVVFGEEDAAKWQMALRSMGVEPLMLSGAAGRA